jgi:putative oxidoreductase
MTSVALLILRLAVGSLIAGHGAQKLFGWFGGYGLQGVAAWLESMNLRPGRQWALVAGVGEFGGGLLTALGALNPLGPIMTSGSMLMATLKVHRGKPIWSSEGGAELPLTNVAALGAIALAGPGRLSVDSLLGIRVPRWFGLAALLGMIATVAWGARVSETNVEQEATAQEQESGAKVQGGVGAGSSPGGPTGADDAPEGRPDLGSTAPSDRPGVEAWGSPDEDERADDQAIAAMSREEP